MEDTKPIIKRNEKKPRNRGMKINQNVKYNIPCSQIYINENNSNDSIIGNISNAEANGFKVECSLLGKDLVDKIMRRYEEFGYKFCAQSSPLLEPFYKNGKTSETQFTYEDKKRIVNFYNQWFVERNVKDRKKIEFYMPYFGEQPTYEKIFTPIEFMRYKFENLFCCSEPKHIDCKTDLNLEKDRKGNTKQVK